MFGFLDFVLPLHYASKLSEGNADEPGAPTGFMSSTALRGQPSTAVSPQTAHAFDYAVRGHGLLSDVQCIVEAFHNSIAAPQWHAPAHGHLPDRVRSRQPVAPELRVGYREAVRQLN
ncbi:MAG: hypothetical protein F9K29_22655 [Hyphomicrobiaceae bacterium]|nr:MAG: hypothetical protein F9K29_22655 [Hyphomicrobiaceae bacterium]